MECTLREWNLSISWYNSYRNIVLGQPRKFSKNENFKSNRNIIQIKKCVSWKNVKNLIYVLNCIVFELRLVTLGG